MASVTLEADSPVKSEQGLASTIAASTIGTVVEWYDFLLYATAAALIFNKLFFPQFDPVAGTIASFAAYAVGFAVRPIGGIVFGALGDRIGRKPVLLATLILMGLATSLIGLLPTYAQAGIWAPILLVALRVMQGFGAGAEYAGAIVMAAEAAPGRRGFFASLPAAAVDVATVTSAGIFALFSLMPEDIFLAWGWRLPFLLSFAILILGAYIRRRVPESPEFVAIKERHREARMPVVTLLKKEPSRRRAGRDGRQSRPQPLLRVPDLHARLCDQQARLSQADDPHRRDGVLDRRRGRLRRVRLALRHFRPPPGNDHRRHLHRTLCTGVLPDPRRRHAMDRRAGDDRRPRARRPLDVRRAAVVLLRSIPARSALQRDCLRARSDRRGRSRPAPARRHRAAQPVQRQRLAHRRADGGNEPDHAGVGSAGAEGARGTIKPRAQRLAFAVVRKGHEWDNVSGPWE